MSSPVAAGETVVSINSQSSLGGRGLLQAVAVARAGQRVELVAAIGQDGESIPGYLQSFGVGSKACRTVQRRAPNVRVYIVHLSIEN